MTRQSSDQLSPTSDTNNPVRRVILDVTISATTELNTGIQRVVRSVALASQSISKELEVECVPVVCTGGHLSAVRHDCRPRFDERVLRSIGGLWMGMHRSIAGLFSKVHSGSGEKYLRFLSRLRKLFVPKTMVRWLGTTYRRLTRQTVEFQEGDVMILLDASWDLPLQEILDAAKAKSVPTATVIYDLIPVTHPEFHEEQLRAVFSQWLNVVVSQTDYLIGISQTVRDEVVQYARQQQETEPDSKRFDYFRLGADFATRKSVAEKPKSPSTDFAESRLRICDLLSQQQCQKYYLTVGTIEPRKNHAFLLDAFEKVWSEDPSVPLVIAGKVGWMCEDVVNRIRSHRLLNRSLFFVEDATDQELAWLYQNGKALIFPSIVEGFGLPIVEAFHHNLPVLASATKIHKEVGGQSAIYFDLADPSELSTLIQEVESGKSLTATSEPNSISWNESCLDLLSKVLKFFETKPARFAQNQDHSDRRVA